MKANIISLSALFIVFSFTSHGEASIVLRLRVEPASQLPAIEPSLRVEAVNTGSEPAHLPRTVALQVTPPEGREPFIAYTGMRGYDRVTWFHAGVEDAPSIVLAPKETVDLSFWAGPGSPVWFAADSRLLSPGTYRFQLVAHDKLDSALLEEIGRVVDQPGLTDPIVSNEATYVVESPQGKDAAVWELIKQLPSPTFWRDPLGQQIWAEYPQSRYAAFCLSERNSDDPAVSIATRKAALEKAPTPSWADWDRFGIAQYELQRSSHLVSARDAEGAFEASRRAKVILDQLAKDGLSPDLRKRAQTLLNTHIWTREAIVRFIKRLDNELKETAPFALCVEKTGDGKHIFWFGYENYTREPMTIPIGAENKFTPPPFDRGQPTIFPPHRTVLGMRLETTEPAVMWHLQNYNVQASLAKTPPCPADLHERFTYEPPQRP